MKIWVRPMSEVCVHVVALVALSASGLDVVVSVRHLSV
jgi:hypothetical protein